MKHYTCDKCEMPMDREENMEIDGKEYDICIPCQNKIMERLGDKGRNIQKQNRDYEDSYRYLKYIKTSF